MQFRRSWTSEDAVCSLPVKRALPAAAGSPRSHKQPGLRATIGRGLEDLRRGPVGPSDRVRCRGGGAKRATETQPGLLDALNELVQSSIRGDPEAPLRWVSKSQRKLSAALAKQGFIAGQKLVGRLLKQLGFSLQANAKTREGTSHPARNAQFEGE
jgi:hypothetical protein